MSKGSVIDITFLAGILLLIAVGSYFGLMLLTSFTNEIQQTAGVNETQAYALTETIETGSYLALDQSFALLFVGMNIAIIFFSLMVRSHPIFFILAILGLAVMGVLAVIFSNIYYEIAITPEFSLTASQMPLTDFIMKNLLPLQLIFGVIDAIVLYSSREGGNEASMYGG